ncbi:phosphate uptake regulator PhoU [Candidatus Woesearchaeota archaeon]|nr:phosphate uptake regulator PhoU [Candidatus Woesearchaeota archaeon]
MDIRNVQKTGDMHYVYLPTHWCREHKIGPKSKVSLIQNIDGSLAISPQITEKKPKNIVLDISEDDQEIIHKLVVACYINPAKSFRINFDKEMDFTKLLNQKRLISLESVELDRKQITSESTITVSDPDALLKTMIRKIKNMITVMQKNYNTELISRYEDEIDRSKMLIDKSIITSLTFEKQSKLNTIDLYYITLISKDLERMVDHMINLPKNEILFFNSVLECVDYLQQIIEDTDNLDYKKAIELVKKTQKIKKPEIKDIKAYDKQRIRLSLDTVADVVMDWAITKEVEKTK